MIRTGETPTRKRSMPLEEETSPKRVCPDNHSALMRRLQDVANDRNSSHWAMTTLITMFPVFIRCLYEVFLKWRRRRRRLPVVSFSSFIPVYVLPDSFMHFYFLLYFFMLTTDNDSFYRDFIHPSWFILTIRWVSSCQLRASINFDGPDVSDWSWSLWPPPNLCAPPISVLLSCVTRVPVTVNICKIEKREVILWRWF